MSLADIVKDMGTKNTTDYNRLYARKRRATPGGRAQNAGSSAGWRNKNPHRVILTTLRLRAKARGLEFSLTEDDLTWPTHCPVLGVELIYGGGHGAHPHSASVDRIDNSKGYVSGNVAVVSWRANRIKNDASAEELRLVAAWVDKQTA